MTRCSLVTDINKIYLGFTIAAFQLERRTTKVSFREDWLEELDKKKHIFNLHRSTKIKRNMSGQEIFGIAVTMRACKIVDNQSFKKLDQTSSMF